MSHMIEMRKLTTGEMGSFVASREGAWHQLGHVAGRELTIDEAIELLNPGQIVKMPIYSDFVLPSGPVMIPMAGKMGTYRVRRRGHPAGRRLRDLLPVPGHRRFPLPRPGRRRHRRGRERNGPAQRRQAFVHVPGAARHRQGRRAG